MKDDQWYLLKSAQDVISPALLFYSERIRDNINEMIRIAGSAERLWPHIKTHKCANLIGLQLKSGIDKFKCSTLAEAALLGSCGVREAVLAMQPSSAHLDKLLQLGKVYPGTRFSTLVDNQDSLEMMRERAKAASQKVHLWLDVNNGMNRTGIVPGPEAVDLCEAICSDPWLVFMGLHVYDGHIRDTDSLIRAKKCHRDMQPVHAMADQIAEKGLKINTIIAGGSPGFTIHAKSKEFDLSPGTTVLWDAGYYKKFTEMPFKPAAALLTRVISKPAPGVVCTDLGHKSVASEMPFPRIEFLNLEACEQVSQSEEHLVLNCTEYERCDVGETIYALPMHICPTVSKYPRAHVVEDNEITGTWSITAIDHDVELKSEPNA